MSAPVLLADTATKLPADAAGAVLICGSHGGAYAALALLRAGVGAALLNDAGVGKDGAGVAVLALAEALGVPAATIAHTSCRIGEAADMAARGVVSFANGPARAAGVGPGMEVAEAAALLAEAAAAPYPPPPPPTETRAEIAAPTPIVLIDSAAMAGLGDAGKLVVTGSHGALVGGDPAAALRTEARCGVFNDAGFGAEECGVARLRALESRGVAGLAVAALSARIGEARSSFEDGVISAANAVAVQRGAAVGDPLRPLIERWSREG